MNKKHRIIIAGTGVVAAVCLLVLPWFLITAPIPLHELAMEANRPALYDRNGKILSYTLKRGWNLHEQLPLHAIPALLQDAFVISEDKRFYQHNGIDWLARLNAVRQDIQAMQFVRGASTITEQVVRMLHPRNKSLWSKWLAGIEAIKLETIESKMNILEFYLNQVPYSSELRGVKQASRYYFSRDLDTLSIREMLALAVIVRAPGIYTKPENTGLLVEQTQYLAQRLHSAGKINSATLASIVRQPLNLTRLPNPAQAFHFATYAWQQNPQAGSQLQTTLDSTLQDVAKSLLDQRLQQLAHRNVHNGAVLVVDHQNREILAWVVAGDIKQKTSGAFIDAVTTPRQPGSTLKPFIYAMALDQGWTASTLIRDEPLQTAVGNGQHNYHNYSHTFYGDLTLREALANSLNIPAVKTLEFVGHETALKKLQQAGFSNLSRHPSVYGAGLALGNGEVSLLELVQAYTVLADRGIFLPLKSAFVSDTLQGKQVFSVEATSIISDILSDNNARQLEFGEGNTLAFPIQTAAKTGTSTNYVDAWIVAYNHRYVVGIWMGNLDRTPMKEVTGSTGPALVAHGIFRELNRHNEPAPLYLSRKLVQRRACTGKDQQGQCLYRDEWFIPGTEPTNAEADQATAMQTHDIHIEKPGDGLHMAMDPRIPDALEAYEFTLNDSESLQEVEWYMNGILIGKTSGAQMLWNLERGEHTLHAIITNKSNKRHLTKSVRFYVK